MNLLNRFSFELPTRIEYGIGAARKLTEALGGKYDAAHAVCNAVVLPVVMEYNMKYAVINTPGSPLLWELPAIRHAPRVPARLSTP